MYFADIFYHNIINKSSISGENKLRKNKFGRKYMNPNRKILNTAGAVIISSASAVSG